MLENRCERVSDEGALGNGFDLGRGNIRDEGDERREDGE
jgi:hypothetical protein